MTHPASEPGIPVGLNLIRRPVPWHHHSISQGFSDWKTKEKPNNSRHIGDLE
jgi:hypothetical protein